MIQPSPMARESQRPLAGLAQVTELPAVVDEVGEDAEGAEDEHEDGQGEDGGLPARAEVVEEEALDAGRGYVEISRGGRGCHCRVGVSHPKLFE